MALLGRFNGQGLGASIEEVVSSHAMEMDVPSRCHHEAIHIKQGSSHIQVLIRTTPGVEYIKVRKPADYGSASISPETHGTAVLVKLTPT